jgi:hypothetical protein
MKTKTILRASLLGAMVALTTVSAFSQTDEELARQLKEAQTKKAVYEAQTAAENARKAKAEADKAATEAESAKALQATTQEMAAQTLLLDYQTKVIAQDKAKVAVGADKINLYQDALSFTTTDFKREATAPQATVAQFNNALTQTAVIATNIAKQVKSAATESCQKQPAIVMRDSDAVRQLVSSYVDTVLGARSMEMELRENSVSSTSRSGERIAPAVAGAVSLFNSLATFAASVRPTTNYGTGSATSAVFTADTLAGLVASQFSPRRVVGSATFVDLSAASPDVSIVKSTPTEDSYMVSLTVELNKFDVSFVRVSNRILRMELELHALESAKKTTEVAVLTAEIARVKDLQKRARDFRTNLYTKENGLTLLTRLMTVDRFVRSDPSPCLAWLAVNNVTTLSDLRALQPAFSRQVTWVRSTAVANWSLRQADGTWLAGGMEHQTSAWAKEDPPKE